MAIKIVKVWAVKVDDKYLAYIERHPTCSVKGTLRVMRGSVLIAEKEVFVNAPGPFGPHMYDNAEWSKAVVAIVEEHEAVEAHRNR